MDPATGEDLLSWEWELKGFLHLVDEPDIQEQWGRIHDELCTLPVMRESFGMIHNDPHLWNVRWQQGKAVLLDFETVNHFWFAYDLTTAPARCVDALRRPDAAYKAPRVVGRFLKGISCWLSTRK